MKLKGPAAFVTVAVLLVVPSAGSAVADPTGPVVTWTFAGTVGLNGWYVSDTSISWFFSDPETGIKSFTGCEWTTFSSDVAPTTLKCAATNNADVTTTIDLPFKLDKTPPSLPTAAVARAPDAEGWYNHSVGVSFTSTDTTSGLDSCAGDSYAGPDSATASVVGTCRDHAGNVAPGSFSLKYDATPPSVTVAAARAPDSNGWFNHAVTVAATGADAVSGVASCTSPSYAGPDSASAAVGATCRDKAGNTSAAAIATLRYDATAPAVTAAADRAPDHSGWYRKPLTVSFAGTDVTSGIASCTAPTRYAGPDLTKAAVAGSCRDAAGNAAEAGQAFQYDATAPKLPEAKAQVEQGVARIIWKRSPDAVLVELERSPGVNGARQTIVYRGKGVSFADKTVHGGVRYRYEIRAADVAGNLAKKVVTAAVDRPALYRPVAGAAVRVPLVLAWEAAASASYYNVQLYRNRVKVLTSWPKAATLRVGKTWTYAGKVQRLGPGRYNWYVWGASGTRAKPKYGKLLGSSTFVVK